MSRIEWDKTSERIYETGTSNGVLYVYDSATSKYGEGVGWNGLTAVTENPSGAEPTALWADNIKYLTLMSAEEFGCTIEAYTYPDAFEECDGSAALTDGVYVRQQTRKTFAFCYRTEVGNDTDGNDHGYKIHIVYGCLASPSSKNYTTINDSPEAIQFSWEVTTTPVTVPDMTIGGVLTKFKPTAYVEVDSTKLTSAQKTGNYLSKLEGYLYGTDAGSGVTEIKPTLLMPDEVAQIMTSGALTGAAQNAVA